MHVKAGVTIDHRVTAGARPKQLDGVIQAGLVSAAVEFRILEGFEPRRG